MDDLTLTLPDGTLTFRCGGSGPLVVLAHALGPVSWGALDRLADACTVAVLDWERCTLEPRARAGYAWVEPLAAELGFERAALCAWSMAGPSAIAWAAQRPACLSHLLLVDVAGLGGGIPPLRLRDVPHLLLSRLLGRPTRGLVRVLWRGWVRSDAVDTRPLVEAMLRFLRAEPEFGAPGGARDDEEQDEEEDDDEDDEEEDEEEDDDEAADELRDMLASIDVPTLVLAGRHSQVLGPEHGRRVAERLLRGTLCVFEESSHALQLEEPAAFQDAVAAFVNDRT